MKHLTYLALLFAFGALPAAPEEVEVGLDARLAAAGMKLEVLDATASIDEDRLASPPAHERVLRFENVRVEYPQELAELAGAFGLWANQAQPKAVAAFAEMRAQVIEKVEAQQEEEAINERMTWMAQWLGFEEPHELSREVYTLTSAMITSAVKEAPIEKALLFDRVLLFTQSGLVERLEAGEIVDNFGLAAPDKPRPWSFSWGLEFTMAMTNPEEPASPTFTPSGRFLELVVPIVVADPTQPITEQLAFARGEFIRLIELGKQSYIGSVKGLIENRQFFAMHEAAEVTLALTTLPSKDRRWFLDGMANYIAREYIRKIDGAETAATIWRNLYGTVVDEASLRTVDLWSWAATEDEEEQSPTANKSLTYARYLLATETIAAITEAHGQDFLPRWCMEIRQTPPDERSMATVRTAFTKLTDGGEIETYMEMARERLLADKK